MKTVLFKILFVKVEGQEKSVMMEMRLLVTSEQEGF